MDPISPNTQAILLLTSPLIVGASKSAAELLTHGEYKRFARWMFEHGYEPWKLLTEQADSVLTECADMVHPGRMRKLLSRGFQLSQAIEEWGSRAIWVVSRADAAYPRKLKVRLREDAPAILYGCGQLEAVSHQKALAVVGSREVSETLLDFTSGVGRLAASAGTMIVSGGARGIDQAAMSGAIESGGMALGVLADNLARAVVQRDNRNAIMDGRLVLVSPYDPRAGFNVGNAMQRNKLIYAFADAGLVVNADHNKGGTWNGAMEQLTKHMSIPMYVRSTGEASYALNELRLKGAYDWPNPADSAELNAVFNALPAVNASHTSEGLAAEPKPDTLTLFDE